jgi:hypothetical protein
VRNEDRSASREEHPMQDFVHIRLRVQVTDDNALVQARLRLKEMVQSRTVKKEIVETLSHLGLDVRDVEVVSADGA